MKSVRTLAALAPLALLSCGPPPAQVAGTYSGTQNLLVTGGAGESGSQVVSISQSGGDLSFTLSLCQLKASASSATSFQVGDFKCSKYLASQSWDLSGSGKVDVNANSLSVSLTGKAKNGFVDAPFTWSFSGSRTP